MMNRDSLCFAEQAIAAFAFLDDVFGFSCVSSTPTRVRFESSHVYVEVCHGEYDFEVFLVFGRLHTPAGKDERFYFPFFLKLTNPEVEKKLGERIADTPGEMRTVLHALAQALRDEGHGIIKGEAAVFDRMIGIKWSDFR